MCFRSDGVSRPAVSLLAVVLVAFIASVGCSNNSPTAPSSGDTTVIQTDLVVGTGAEAVAFRTLAVHYTLWLYDASRPDGKGTQLDTSIGGSPFTFVLGTGAVIPGWDVGIPGMRIGGSRRLVIPPAMAYGSAGKGSVPPNATLVFDIQLLGVA